MKWFFSGLARVIYILGYPIIGCLLHNSHRVRAVVIFQGKILLQRSYIGSQQWSLPGGGVERRETPELAAAREVLEETNVKLSPKKFKVLGGRRLPQHTWPQMKITFLGAVLSKPQKPQAVRWFEIIETDWFSLDKLPKKRSGTIDVGLELWKENKD